MTPRERLLLDTTKSIAHAADALSFDAKDLKKAAAESDGSSLASAVERRLAGLRRTMDVLTDQLAALKLLEKV